MIFWAVSASLLAVLATSVAAAVPCNRACASRDVTVRLFEHYTPFEAVTVVGAFANISISRDFRLELSFRAARYNASNAATMSCFSIDQRTSKWTPLPISNTRRTNATAATTTQAFCVRRPLNTTTLATAAVGQFQRRESSGLLVHTVPSLQQYMVHSVKERGWLTPPLVAFDVTQRGLWYARSKAA